MRVRIAYTTDVPDAYRLALAHHWGEHGKASRQDIQRHLRFVGTTEDDDILDEWYDEPCQEARCQP